MVLFFVGVCYFIQIQMANSQPLPHHSVSTCLLKQILIILDLMAFLIFNFDAVKRLYQETKQQYSYTFFRLFVYRSEFERLFIPLKRLYTVDPTNVSSSEPLRQPFQSTFLRRERTDCDRENRHFGHGIVGLMN